MIRALPSVVAFVAIAIWLGGLVALGAIAAPVVFSVVPMPASADAMTVVFRRFDSVAMTCAAAVMAAEAARVVARAPLAPMDYVRGAVVVLAAGAAVFEGALVSPRIAALHQAGVVFGAGRAGEELARWHDVAEWCGKAEVAFLVVAAVLYALVRTPERSEGSD